MAYHFLDGPYFYVVFLVYAVDFPKMDKNDLKI